MASNEDPEEEAVNNDSMRGGITVPKSSTPQEALDDDRVDGVEPDDDDGSKERGNDGLSFSPSNSKRSISAKESRTGVYRT